MKKKKFYKVGIDYICLNISKNYIQAIKQNTNFDKKLKTAKNSIKNFEVTKKMIKANNSISIINFNNI